MSGGRLYRLAWVFYLALAVGAVLWIGARVGPIRPRLFVSAEQWPLDAALGIVGGGALLGLWELGRRLLPRARELEDRLRELLGPLDLAAALALALLSGFAEELFFRGAMQPAWGWIPATLLFAVLHTGPGPSFRLWTAFALVAGLLLAGLFAWRGNLLAPIVAHALVNAVNLGRLAGPGGGSSPAGGPDPADS